MSTHDEQQPATADSDAQGQREQRALAALRAIYERMCHDRAAGDEWAMEWLGECWPGLVPADLRARVGDEDAETDAKDVQPATATHSDAHGQREQLREDAAMWAYVRDEMHKLMSDEDDGDEDMSELIVRFVRRQIARAQTAEAGLTESSWPDGGPGDDPPEVKLAKMRRRAEKAEAERDQQQDETLREHARAEAAEQERDELQRRVHITHESLKKKTEQSHEAKREIDALREHVDADHQVLSQVRDLHRPFALYGECGHDHTEADLDAGTAFEVDDLGLSCADGKLYDICRECHLQHGQFDSEPEWVADSTTARWPCPTMRALTGDADE